MDAQLIRMIRLNANMKQIEFARLIDEHISQLAQVEAGYRKPTNKMIESIRDKFDARYIELVKQVIEHERKCNT